MENLQLHHVFRVAEQHDPRSVGPVVISGMMPLDVVHSFFVRQNVRGRDDAAFTLPRGVEPSGASFISW
jgi:hypothetical protein